MENEVVLWLFPVFFSELSRVVLLLIGFILGFLGCFFPTCFEFFKGFLRLS